MSILKKLKYTFWGMKGNYLSHKMRFEKAIKIYSEMIEMDPTKTRPYRDKLYCLMAYNRYAEAIEVVDGLIAIEPDNPEYHYIKGSLLTSNDIQQYEQALTHYDQAIALKKDHMMSYLEKGLSLMNLERYDEAIDNLNQAIFITPEKAYWAYYYKAIIMKKRGKYDAAINLCNTALVTDMGKNFDKSMASSLKDQLLKLADEKGNV
ncbi:tetratricopeptide repeat protein [Desulfuribacillus alkaliarsenatis]|uniref:Uncharacterized protein n=1 Tax=Desulfuribacillus alkaliarsenatis TaxID=766136 RepID=A0A1E5G3P3_9FIRM|nr:tetratricopeptide repeat protein [Desulfuribacillus alkaliarsenatis]OEF97683.1 hypothetical protein BHF68_14370 [Desulfuribacillus alkaliarsenatis]